MKLALKPLGRVDIPQANIQDMPLPPQPGIPTIDE